MFSATMKLLLVAAWAQTLTAQSLYSCDDGITPPSNFKCDGDKPFCCKDANTANNAFPYEKTCYYGSDQNGDYFWPDCHDKGVIYCVSTG
ncbi:hypothetical protein BUE80_DR006194 [Diplocarpon rosae]|nr:hypothetical protein BUE80_DR006194 [Diplocarpon rosae]